MTGFVSTCPLCRTTRTLPSDRYLGHVCSACTSRAVAPSTGRGVEGFNASMSGGFVAYYTDTQVPQAEECDEVTRGHVVHIDGQEFWLDEARFGGVVAMPLDRVEHPVARALLTRRLTQVEDRARARAAGDRRPRKGRATDALKDAAEGSPGGYLVGLALVVGWVLVPRWVQQEHGWPEGLAALLGYTGFLFLWGWIERRLEPRLAERRVERTVRAAAEGKEPVSLPWYRKLIRWAARVVLVAVVVVAAVVWYGALLISPTVLIAMLVGGPLMALGMDVAGGLVALVAAPLIGLPLGVWWVHWWVTRATPDHVAMANAAGMAG